MRRFPFASNWRPKIRRSPPAHDCLYYAYWAKHMYPQVVEEYKIHAQLTGDPIDVNFAAAQERGFRASGWSGAVIQAIESLQARVRPATGPPT